MPAMRLALDRTGASAVRLSIAAAIVMRNLSTGNYLQFSA
jgi:hypothetical protein